MGSPPSKPNSVSRTPRPRVPIGLDKLHPYRDRRSRSACAKNAEALRRISFAHFSSRFSRFNSFSCCVSSVLSPPRSPCSRSTWWTHFRNVSTVQPIFDAIDVMAARCDAYSRWLSKTNWTARSRTSGGYRFVLPIVTHVLSRNETSRKPGAVQLVSGAARPGRPARHAPTIAIVQPLSNRRRAPRHTDPVTQRYQNQRDLCMTL